VAFMVRGASGSPGLPGTAGTVSHDLPTDLSAVREARRLVREVLDDWRADEIFDDVELVASELVANALRHGLGARPGDRPGPPALRISLVSTGSHVICAVTDPSETPPVRRIADPLAGSGRGLQLVESLSLCWGWTVLDDDPEAATAQGKSVWAIFPFDLPGRARIVGAA
jgi:anti-sigma regulatory factor (Ser/Thr protein kinase)